MSPTFLARTIRGLEWVAAAEIDSAIDGSHAIMLGVRDVRFRSPDITALIDRLRCVDDLFVGIGAIDGVGFTKAAVDRIAGHAARLDVGAAIAHVAKVRDLPAAPTFDVVTSLDGKRRFNRYAVEDAVGAAMAASVGGEYVSRTHGRAPDTDLSLRVLIHGASARILVRVASRPLHRRDYKQDTGAGTLHPPLAAALARLAGDADNVADIFCGDGTIPIERALLCPDGRIAALDFDAARVAHARRNADRAGVPVHLAQADAAQLPLAADSLDAIVTNPPWGVTVSATPGVLDSFWSEAARVLSDPGRLAIVADLSIGAVPTLRRLGWQIAMAQPIRLAGRVSVIVLASPPGTASERLSEPLTAWRQRALDSGVIVEDGF